jgi:hypothetical protein
VCIERSNLARVISLDTVRSVIESALDEIYRGGEFQLEPLWQILEREPGISARDAAAPLLAFKSFEHEAGLRVRLPDTVESFNAEERELLRGTVDVPRARVSNLIGELHALEVTGPHALVEARGGRAGRSLLPSASTRPPPSTLPLLAAVVVLAMGLAALAYLLAR